VRWVLISCVRGVFSEFEDGYYNCFSPGIGKCVLFPYTAVHEGEETLATGERWHSILL